MLDNMRIVDLYARRHGGQEADPAATRPNAPPRPGAKRAPVPMFGAHLNRLKQQAAAVSARLRRKD